jgi:hypothetical protein
LLLPIDIVIAILVSIEFSNGFPRHSHIRLVLIGTSRPPPSGIVVVIVIVIGIILVDAGIVFTVVAAVVAFRFWVAGSTAGSSPPRRFFLVFGFGRRVDHNSVLLFVFVLAFLLCE